MSKHFTITCIFLAIFQYIDIQNHSLKTAFFSPIYSYSRIDQLKKDSSNNSCKEIAKARISIVKAKAEKDWNKLTEAYKIIIYNSNTKEGLRYADSLLATAEQSKDNLFIGNAYLTKGIFYYSQKEQTKALDNYILASEYLVKTDDEYAKYKLKFAIAQTKYYLGFYDEAIALFKECVNYYKVENEAGYLNSLHSLGLCYIQINKYNFVSYYNKLGLQVSKECDNNIMVPYFNQSEGVNQYFKKNYKIALDKLTNSLTAIQSKNDFASVSVSDFYIGKSYWDLNQKEKAVPYFLKVDEAFAEHNYIRPNLRESYEILIDYYKTQNKLQLQLKYVNRLLLVDKHINQNYKYLSRKITKEYDTKNLLQSKQKIEQSLKWTKQIDYLAIAALLGVVGFLCFQHFKNKRHFKQKFEELMNENVQNKKSINTSNNSQEDLDINPEIVAVILKNMEEFENNNKFLESDLTLVKLAGLLNTNTKYASKIIYKYRGKKANEYVSDLKIGYIVELLKTENKFRLYTNAALAEEVGFSTTQNFTRAFKARTGISPTDFIKELQKSFPL